MKRFLSILLVISLIFYLAGYVLLYFCRLNSIKEEQNISKRRRTDEVVITKFAFPIFRINNNDVIFCNEDELIYFGRIYDIISSNQDNDTLFVSAVYDEKENLLNDAFAGIVTLQNETQKGFHGAVSLNPEILFFGPDGYGLCYFPVFLFSIDDNPESVTEIYLNKISPPPKNRIALHS